VSSRVKGARRALWAALLLLAVGGAGPQPGLAAGPGRGAEPSRPAGGAGRGKPGETPGSGAARSGEPGGRTHETTSSETRGDDQTRTLGREGPGSERTGRADRSRATKGEPRAPERPLHEDPAFHALVAKVPSLRTVLDRIGGKIEGKLNPEVREMLGKADEILGKMLEKQRDAAGGNKEGGSKAGGPTGAARPAKERASPRVPRDFKTAVANAKEAIARANNERGKSDRPSQTVRDTHDTREAFDALGAELAGKIPRAAYSGRGPKDPQRLAQKIKDKGDFSEMFDLIAGRITVDSMHDAAAALNHIVEKLGREEQIHLVNVSDRFSNPQDSGYRDAVMHIEMPDHHVCELQLMLKPLRELSDNQHVLYEISRDLKDLTAGREMTEAEAGLRKAFDQVTNPLFERAYNDSLKPANKDAPSRPVAESRHEPGGPVAHPRRAPLRARPWHQSAGRRREHHHPMSAVLF
jgi:hypothetical protein